MQTHMIDFEKELNKEQLDVVLHGDGPCLVLAGAGSGKTRTIIYRVAYLLEKGVSPENILLVTFTNKAANEMKERVVKLIAESKGRQTPPSLPLERGGSQTLSWSGTFHHIAYRILRQYAPLIGYGNNFSVLDSDDSESIIKICIKENRLDSAQRFPSASNVLSAISFSRNASRPLAEVLEERYPQWQMFTTEIERIASAYERRKKEANAMDFDDLLINFLLLLNDQKIHEKFANQFQYILVDEYQDTNIIQAAIIKKLASVHKNVLCVGDDAQSIYSFRAAMIENILKFEKDYPGAKIFKLETNYRSSQEILEVANNVIEKNREQYRKNLKTILRGEKPELYPQIDQQSEGQFVAEKIADLLKAGTSPREISVLFRAAHHSQMLEVELVQRGIEYDYRGGIRFFERSHIKDILAYLRALNNVADSAAWLRLLMHEEGIGPVAAQKVIESLRGLPSANVVVDTGRATLSGKALQGWENFGAIWSKLLAAPLTVPSELVKTILVSPYRDYLEAEFVDSKERMQDLMQLALFAEKFDDLAEFLASTTLQESFAPPTYLSPALSSVEAERGVEPSPPQRRGQGEVSPLAGTVSGKVVLSTIHQAKGLEWEAVFMINLANGSFPSERSSREARGLEEERRLFYVAVTRAKRKLFLTYPMAGGMYGDFLPGPSRFLEEISSDALNDHSLLSTDVTVFNDPSAGVEYISEEAPKKFSPGSFLRDINDL